MGGTGEKAGAAAFQGKGKSCCFLRGKESKLLLFLSLPASH